MYYVDVKYLRLLSSRLPKFKQLNDHSWNCRCILCGDSKRNENKSRGYFYKSKDYIVYKCHNCGVSKTLYDFLKSVDSALHKEYIFELYKESTVAKSSLSKETSKEVLTRYDFRLEQISCAKCLLNIRQALRKTAGVVKCEVALRKPYGAVIIADAKANEAKIKDVVASADPGTHPRAVDFIAEPVKEVPVVLLPKHNGLKKD